MRKFRVLHLEWLLPLVILLATTALALDFYLRELDEVEERKADQAIALQTKLQLAINERIAILASAADAFFVSKYVSRKEFSALAKRLLARSPKTAAIEWIPELRFDNLAGYRQVMQKEGVDVDFLRLDPASGGLVPITQDDQRTIAPIVYAEPYEANKAALGFDLMSSEPRQRLLLSARMSGQIVISEPIQLVEDSNGVASFLLTKYETNSSQQGWLMGVWRVPDFVDDILLSMDIPQDDFYLYDVTDESSTSMYPTLNPKRDRHDHEHSSLTLKVANRSWEFVIGHHAPNYLVFAPALGFIVLGLVLSTVAFYGLRNARMRQDALVETEILSLRLEQEAQAAAQLEEFKRYLDAAPISVGILEGDRHSRRYTYVNEQMCKTFGYSREQLVGLNATLNMFVLDEERDAFNRLVWASMDNDETFVAKAQMRLGDGSSRYFELAGRYRREGEKLFGTLFYYDITERVKYEKAQADLLESERKLTQSRKLQAMGNLLGGMAHSLNNQLQPILILLSMLKRRVNEDAKAVEYVGKMETAANAATDILQRTLATSRAEHGYSRTDFNQALAKALDIALLGMPPNIKVSQQLKQVTGVGPLDQVDLEVVLLNLVNNAKDAIGVQQGHIDIQMMDCPPEPSRVEDEALLAKRWICLCVKDDGAGMSPEQLSRVLDPFYTTKPVGQGTGLGLSETQGLVSRAGGYITIDSEEGDGASICVHLPIYDSKENENGARTVN